MESGGHRAAGGRRAQALEAVGRLEEAARWYGSFGEEADLDLVYLAAGMVGRGRVLGALGRDDESAGAYRRAAELLTRPEGVWLELRDEAGVAGAPGEGRGGSP